MFCGFDCLSLVCYICLSSHNIKPRTEPIYRLTNSLTTSYLCLLSY